jgi:Kef-type K+ transport system membrane component KefB
LSHIAPPRAHGRHRILSDLLLLFTLAVAVVLVFDRIRLRSIVGFLITGWSGPTGSASPGTCRSHVLANIGVILYSSRSSSHL